MRRAVGTILEAGFQMESEAFKTLVEKGREDSLKPLVDEVLKMAKDRKSTRLNSSHSQISYAVFCLKKKKNKQLSQLHIQHLINSLQQSLNHTLDTLRHV